MNRPKLQFHEIERFLVYSEQDGKKMYCEFQNSDGDVYQSSARLKMEKNVSNTVKKQVTRVAVSQAKRQASRMLRRALGGGILGRTGSSILRSGVSNMNTGQHQFSQEEKQNAILDAFQRVRRHFADDLGESNTDTKIKIKSKKERTVRIKKPRARHMSYYDKMLDQFTAQANNFDKEVLARMLVGLAQADGRLSFEEREFLELLIPSEVGNIEALEQMGELSEVEAEEVNHKVKEPILFLTAVMALVDFELDPDEIAWLEHYADRLGFSTHKAGNCLLEAKKHILNQEISAHTDKDTLFRLADKIDLEHKEAERAWIQFKKTAE